MKISRKSFSNGLSFLLAAGSLGAVLWPLADLRATFQADWNNHLWLIGYFGEYFKTWGSFPIALNTPELLGDPRPVYYGYLFYPTAGFISRFAGPALALRALVVCFYAGQYYCVWRLVFRLSRQPRLADLVALLVTWAIYPLTNLYNRSAITEFSATALAVMSFCLFFTMLLSRSGKVRFIETAFFAVLTVFCLGTLPITALYYSVFLVLAATIFSREFLLFIKAGDQALFLAGSCFLAFIVLLPWLLAVLSMRGDLSVSSCSEGVVYYPWIDSLFARFGPFPSLRDFQTQPHGLRDPGTPYLDAQMNVPLLLFLIMIGKAGPRRSGPEAASSPGRKALLYARSLFYVTSVLSVSVFFYDFLPGVFRQIQFCYRMVTYQNLSLLLILTVLLFYFHIRWRRWMFWAAAGVVIISLAGLGVKLGHAVAVKELASAPEVTHGAGMRTAQPVFSKLPDEYFAWRHDFVNWKLIEPGEGPVSGSVALPLLENAFGKVRETTVDLDKPGWLITNVYRFCWNQVLVDGRPEPVRGDRLVMAVRAPAGKHRIGTIFQAPFFYRLSRRIGMSVFFISISLLVFGSLAQAAGCIRKRDRS